VSESKHPSDKLIALEGGKHKTNVLSDNEEANSVRSLPVDLGVDLSLCLIKRLASEYQSERTERDGLCRLPHENEFDTNYQLPIQRVD
jgi:hypothetical protein